MRIFINSARDASENPLPASFKDWSDSLVSAYLQQKRAQKLFIHINNSTISVKNLIREQPMDIVSLTLYGKDNGSKRNTFNEAI